MNYQEFIESKKHTTGQFGFEPVYFPEQIFDFQKAIIEKAVRKGRMGIFADTGLGKTRISLAIAQNIVLKT
jgi:superfamily II DNA or RNA helicase